MRDASGRTGKVERRRARRAWPQACQQWGTAYIARIARDRSTHLRLAICQALDVPPYVMMPTVASRGKAVGLLPPILVETWHHSGQVQRARWMRADTGAFYMASMPVEVRVEDDDEGEMRQWRAHMDAAVAELWQRGPYDAP